MNYSVPDCFMISLVCGFLFGAVYEALRVIRLILKFRAAVFVCDVIFFFLAALAVEALCPVLGSYVRSCTVLGFASGVFAYIVTIGRILNLLESAAAEAWRLTIGRFIRFISGKLKSSFGAFAHKMRAEISNVYNFSLKIGKKPLGYLKSHHKKVYNNSNSNNKGSETSHVIKAQVRRSR